MKTRLLATGLIAASALLSGCVVAPAYDGPGYYGSAVVVAPPVVFSPYGYYGYYGYHGGYGYRGGGYRYRGPYRRW